MTYRTSQGQFLLSADPTRGLALPVEKNPRRPVYDNDRYSRLLAVADRIAMRIGWGSDAVTAPSYLRDLLPLARGTGRRISSILALRYSDWNPRQKPHGWLRWRADADKLGREWWAPVSPDVRSVLERMRRERPGVGDGLLFPAPGRPDRPVNQRVAGQWLRQAEQLAKLPHVPGGAWHPFRRMWATARKHLSPQDVAAVGGWVDTTTLARCYQVADAETMVAVVLGGRRLGRRR